MMEYKSILGRRGGRVKNKVLEDLKMNNLLADILGKNRDEFLEELFLEELESKDVAVFRLNVFKDLLKPGVFEAVSEFVEKIKDAERLLELEKDIYHEFVIGVHLDAALIYVNAIESFFEEMKSLEVNSEGFKYFLSYLQNVANSKDFLQMKERMIEAERMRRRIKIKVRINGDKIKVRRDEDGISLFSLVEKLFSRFKGEEIEQVRYIRRAGEMSHIHAAILKGAFEFYKNEYEALKNFVRDFPVIIDEGIANFVKEVTFYLIYINYMNKISEKGYPFSIPSFSEDGHINVKGFYNLLLAKMGKAVPNDIWSDGLKRVFIITGMNSGGKTTFAISFGQLVYLSKLGVPVPAAEAELPFFSQIMTAFPVEEDESESLSRLEQDIVRAKKILEHCDNLTVIIANELFSTTTSVEGYKLSKLFLERIIEKKAYCLYVTFIHKVAELEGVVSLVAQPSIEDPEKPSYRIIPSPPPSKYMAIRIAEKYQLVYDEIRRDLN